MNPKPESYKLPVCDTQKEKRSFPGYDKTEYYSMEDIRKGDYSGTTETDSKTDPKGSGGYTPINTKSGKGRKSR